MTTRPVHWHEGMFLRPHHFQAAERHWLEHGDRSEKWDLHYNWGLRAIDLDRDALANHRFVVRSLKARLRDGTLISVPDDGVVPDVDLKPAFGRERTIDVFLALPVSQVGRANVAGAGRSEGTRFLLDSRDLEDENTGTNPQPLQVRLLNFTLLMSGQDATGYETIPIARVRKADRPEATPELDITYIPPVLACDGWLPLGLGILQVICDRIGTKLNTIASQVMSRNLAFGSQASEDQLLFGQLRALNEAYALLRVITFAQGVHPFPAYLELCRLVGQLAIYGKDRRVPDLPKYDHDDLAGCFYRVKQYLDDLLDQFIEPDYIERPFEGVGLRMQVGLENPWLQPGWLMFIGVRTPLTAEECVKLLTLKGQLDMKIGSSDRVDQMMQAGQAGLQFTPAPQRPQSLPGGCIYFQVDRQSQQAEWQHVQRSLSLGIRLNQTRVVGNIQGQRELTIRMGGGQTTTLQFTLFVVKSAK